MSEHLVCLTFDHDNTSANIARGFTTPTMISRGDFGIVAVPRILALLDKYDIRSTWFTPGHTIDSYPRSVATVRDAGHEIGHHGWTHRLPSALGRAGEETELIRGIEAIVKLTGQPPKGYRSPAWDLSPHSVELLLKHGFVYDSSMMGHDSLPYQARMGDRIPELEKMVFGEDTALVEMPVHWSLDDFPHFEYSRYDNGILPGLMNARLVLENWLQDFAYMKQSQDWGVLTYTFHPHIIGRGHRLLMLEELIQQLSAQGAVFVSMESAVQSYRARFPEGISLRDA